MNNALGGASMNGIKGVGIQNGEADNSVRVEYTLSESLENQVFAKDFVNTLYAFVQQQPGLSQLFCK